MNRNKKSKLWKTVMFGALGDAMGYQIEFSSEADIDSKYDGEVTFEKLVNGKLQISDDTQMALYTLEAILKNPTDPLENIYQGYLDWAWTQLYAINPNIKLTHPGVSELAEIDAMRQARAPGNTCMNALMSGTKGTLDKRINDSKGCGGVMRLGPLAVYYAENSDWSIHDISMLGVDASCITHGHNMSVFSSYHFTNLLVRLARDERGNLEEVVKISLKDTTKTFENYVEIDEYESLIEQSIILFKMDGLDDREQVHQLGEGWIAEEAVAIAIYCVLKYKDDIETALTVSVNHKGDSDSTGILVGNILGLSMFWDFNEFSYLKKIDEYEIINDENFYLNHIEERRSRL